MILIEVIGMGRIGEDMKHEQLTFDAAVKRAKEKMVEGDTTIIAELELHPDGLWTMRYIYPNDPEVLYEVPLN